MRIDFNQDGSIKKLLVNEFVNQLSSGTTILVYVLGATSSDYTVRAYGTLPNGENHVLSTNVNDGSTWKITLNSSDTAYYGKLAITVQVIMSISNFTFTYPLYLTINPTIPGSVQFPISLDELNTFLSQLQSYPTKAEVSSMFQRKYDAYNVRFYKDNADYTADISNIADKQGIFKYDQESNSVGFYFKNGNNFSYTLINESIKAQQDSQGNVIKDTYLPKQVSDNANSFVYAYDSTGQKVYEASQEMRGENVIPLRRAGGQITVAQYPESGTDAASKYYVDNSISNLSARYLTKNANGDSFLTYAELVAGPWYYGGSQVLRDRNDYAFVQQDETHENKSARYVYQAGEWLFQYTIDTGASLITDVRVNGVSVVSNTVANIDIDTSNLVELDNAQDITGVKNFTNGLKIGNSPITFSNNELQVVNDIVGNEGNNLGSQAKPFNKLYAKYFNDGSGNEATLSDLTNGIIKEINTRYVRIWDLDVGIYKLTYNGNKYLYYDGSSSTNSVNIYSGTQILKIWACGNSKNYECTSGHSNGGIVITGQTFQNSGNFHFTYNGGYIKTINGSGLQYLETIYVPTTAGTSGQVLVSNGSYNAPTWSSDFYTKTEVDNAIQNAIGNVLNGDF